MYVQARRFSIFFNSGFKTNATNTTSTATFVVQNDVRDHSWYNYCGIDIGYPWAKKPTSQFFQQDLAKTDNSVFA